MITREVFMKAVKEIRVAYNNENFLKSNDAMVIWYGKFKDCNEWSFVKAVNKCIGECRRLPVVADIMNPYNEIENKRRKDRYEFINQWHTICDYFPNGKDYYEEKDCTDKIKRMTLDKVNGDYYEAHLLGQKIERMVSDYAKNHNAYENGLDFKKYFMGLEE